MSRYTEAVKLQKKLAPKVITKDVIKKISTVCAVDVAYKDGIANAAAVVVDACTLEVLEHVTCATRIVAPYVPGLMMLRESGPAISALKLLKNRFDVLLVDGNGQLHPRRFGLACYLGMLLDVPTIGVAKSLLCGITKGSFVLLGGKRTAKVLERKKGKKIFVSIGNKMSLRSASRLADSLIMDGRWLPEPLRLADMYSKSRQRT
ncbi:MAG TPA: endonuclease V [Candidatus Nitrosotalea sp.]|nr:endonuclease V [Candidatus Nitrosotalea sp.]